MTLANIYVLEGGDSNQIQRIIGQNVFFFRQFETSEEMRILNIRHVISK
jgi:hypothetical protein